MVTDGYRTRMLQKEPEMCGQKLLLVEYWKGLARSKQPGQGKPGNNTNYDHLCLSHKDILVPPKIQFLDEIAEI